MFVLPELPYAYDALEPVMSGRTLHFHHDKHHAAYVKALNEQLDAAGRPTRPLEAVIVAAWKDTDRKLFNSAAQAWNHSFFWEAMSPQHKKPEGALADAIENSFGTMAGLKKAFVEAGTKQFGSGWVWLVADDKGALHVRSTHDADDTLTQPALTPLLVCDVWEHAYYLDHQNDRARFLAAWFDDLANWQFAARQFDASRGTGKPWRHPAPLPEVAPKKLMAG
jgi:Fe-Mn family superoxide dismutase